ncbi:MAG: DUF2589 domain-containing protein [Okeania sp. SIO2C9]|uniref:DUF2589 domain-containing protein n=1 Tax=Okeania sp. SIO2C9 TaxID=2607791 RepID=UPI0013C12054|nr:DUF2589 domain-containing protein [Okeania sp. SIO2C9]NEQ75115.1 DUF2589 domain-containing protein [Okeania sp. SIO2C9]
MTVQIEATEQLGAIPFGNIIGGPLVAAVEAQSQAAISTVEFIESIGMTEEGDIQNISFKYSTGYTDAENENDSSLTDRTTTYKTLEVPLLTIVPIPYIRIDDMTIQFKANISAETETEKTTTEGTEKDISASVKAKSRWGGTKVQAKFNAAYSAKKDSSSAANSKYAVEYTMDISLHAVQDDMPAGMQKVLTILNDIITSPDAEPVTTTV